MSPDISLIVLAAGKGSRMESDLPKVLHPIGQAPMLWHSLRAGAALEPRATVVVTGHGAEDVEAAGRAWSDDIIFVRQTEQLGTAHAVAQAREALSGAVGDAIVLYGDTPLISEGTLKAMQAARKTHDVVVLGFEAADPTGYGRLLTNGDDLLRIVEQKEASPEEQAVTLCNSGVILADAELMFALIDAVGNDNANGEYYLTDIIGLARDRGHSATVVRCAEAETLGVNTRAQLAQAEAAFQAGFRAQLMADGVTLMAPDTVYLAFDSAIGRDTVIEPNVVFGPGVSVENGATIRAFSHLEGCHLGTGAMVGPYARLRPGAELGENARVGNFCEVKNATLGTGVKVNHLTYIGDASIGAGANVGAGTVTCNYDGVFKHRTEIGENAFIGSSTMLVAPVKIGDGALTASGSVITSDVEAGALAIARGRQENKPGLARRMFEKLKSLKEKSGKSS